MEVGVSLRPAEASATWSVRDVRNRVSVSAHLWSPLKSET